MTRFVLAALLLAIAGMARGQSASPTPTPTPTPSEEAPEARPASPPPPAYQAPPDPVTVRVGRPAGNPDSADAGHLKGIRLVSAEQDEAVVVVKGVTLRVGPGDSIGSDVVRSIAPDRLVLTRPAAAGGEGGEATVVVQFDGSGQGRVRVYSTRDRTAPRAPEVR